MIKGFIKEEANYILKVNESVRLRDPKKKNEFLLKIVIWSILIYLLSLSLYFRKNILYELSFTGRLLVLCLMISRFCYDETSFFPRPMEIWFYDDYLIIYRESIVVLGQKRKQYDKFYYDDIEACVFQRISQKFVLCGQFERIRFKYKRNGIISERPTYHRIKNTIHYFYTDFIQNIDLTSQIEQYSKIEVSERDN